MGRLLEGCRDYLRGRARRLIPPALQGKVGPSDLVQETFVDATRRAGEMPAGRSDELRAWLYRIMALNLSEKRRRFLGTKKGDVRREVRLEATPAGSAQVPLRDRVADDLASPATLVQGLESRERLAVAIAELPEVERRVILWRYWDRLEHAEIGRRLGKSADAARMLHARACRRLFHQFGGESP